MIDYESEDVSYLRKWLNEDIDAPIDRQALARVLASISEAQWLPIESAPKDGTPFLATDGTYCEVLNEPRGCPLGVWTNINGRWVGSSVKHIRSTHWIPLPPLPAPFLGVKD